MTWDFDASTMVRPTKVTEDGVGDSSTAVTMTEAAASNQWTNDEEPPTPIAVSNHKSPFSEEEGEERGEEPPVSPQLGIDETAMVLEDGNRQSFVEGAMKRNSVVMVGGEKVDETDSAEGNAIDKVKVSLPVSSQS